MDELDDEIEKALRDEAESADARIETIRQMLGESFRHRRRGIGLVTWLKGLLMGAVLVFAAVRFFQVDTTREMIAYAALFVYSGIAVMMLWMFYWMMLNRNATVREIKRLELKIAEWLSRKGP